MSTITTHVLDTALGQPATDVAVALERVGPEGLSILVGAGATDGEGRVRDLLAPGETLDRGVTACASRSPHISSATNARASIRWWWWSSPWPVRARIIMSRCCSALTATRRIGGAEAAHQAHVNFVRLRG
jgi:Transthyretin-like protein